MKNFGETQKSINLKFPAHSSSSQKRPIFDSPKMEPWQSNSSYSSTEPFKANTIVIDEVTTAIIDFDYQQLVQFEQRWFFLVIIVG